MRKRILKSLITIAAVSIGLQAQAVDSIGGMEGGGGKAIVCKNADGSTKVQLLDTWEGTTFFHEVPKLATGTVANDVQTAINALKNSYYDNGTCRLNGINYSGQDCVSGTMNYAANFFLTPNSPNVMHVTGVTLPPTTDAFPLGTPDGCELDQVIIYDPNNFIEINDDLYNALSESDQAALITHEAYYYWLRTHANETNSVRTRWAVADVFAGNTLSLNLPTVPTSHISCASNDVGESQNQVDIWLTGNDSQGNADYAVYVRKVEASALIGLAYPTFTMVVKPNDQSFFTSGKCPATGNLDWTWRFNPTGPVERDRGIGLSFSCVNGVSAVLINDQAPGAAAPTSIPLTCQF